MNESVQNPCHDIQGLRQISQDLRTLSTSTEDAFLNIGHRLYEFSQKGKTISDMALSAVNQLLTQEISTAIDNLREMVDRIGNYLDYCDQQLGNDLDVLSDVTALVDDISQPLTSFGRISKRLRLCDANFKRV